MERINVVLPHPEGPIRPVILPAGISKLIWLRIWVPDLFTDNSLARIIVSIKDKWYSGRLRMARSLKYFAWINFRLFTRSRNMLGSVDLPSVACAAPTIMRVHNHCFRVAIPILSSNHYRMKQSLLGGPNGSFANFPTTRATYLWLYGTGESKGNFWRFGSPERLS